jgi:hypothetical protein
MRPVGPAAQAPRDRHSGEHRAGALVFETAARHPLIAVSPPLSKFSRGEVDRREEARAAAVSDERLPRVAHAGPAGDGDLRAAGGEAGPDAESGVLRGDPRLPDGHGRGDRMT